MTSHRQTDEETILESFLYPPRFVHVKSRFLPRLVSKILYVTWRVGRWLGDAVHEHGMDTAGDTVEKEHFHPDRVWYVASGWSFVPRLLRSGDVDTSGTFVDFGSGKGRVLCQAAQYPFSRVIGVEISSELNEVARRNVDLNRKHQACGAVELLTCDATEFEIPDDMTFAYFCNPFVGDSFRAVIDNIVASLDRRPRRMRIAYVIPLMEDYLLETGRFRLVQSRRFLWEQGVHRIAVYESLA